MRISIDELRSLGPNGATIINARKHAGANEIRGAIRYRPADLLSATHLVLPIATDRPIVLYDDDGSGKQLDEIVEKLIESGYPDVRILAEGFAGYATAGGPLQEASTEQVIPPSKPPETADLEH